MTEQQQQSLNICLINEQNHKVTFHLNVKMYFHRHVQSCLLLDELTIEMVDHLANRYLNIKCAVPQNTPTVNFKQFVKVCHCQILFPKDDLDYITGIIVQYRRVWSSC